MNAPQQKNQIPVTLDDDDLAVISELVQTAPFNKVIGLVTKLNSQINEHNMLLQKAEKEAQDIEAAQRDREREAYAASIAATAPDPHSLSKE
jgi:hypothetical protein